MTDFAHIIKQRHPKNGDSNKQYALRDLDLDLSLSFTNEDPPIPAFSLKLQDRDIMSAAAQVPFRTH